MIGARSLLLIEDDFEIRQILEVVLTNENHTVISAQNGQAALDILLKLLEKDNCAAGNAGFSPILRAQTPLLNESDWLLKFSKQKQAVDVGNPHFPPHSSNSPLPGLILLDVSMPIMDGYEFRAEQLKHPRFAAIPTVMLSADSEVRLKAKQLNIEHFLKKPVELNDLLAMVGKYLT